ncbi:MAG: tetratricopeptide repeat protein [Bacteroidota bacterium]
MQFKAHLFPLLLVCSFLFGCKTEKQYLTGNEHAFMARQTTDTYQEPDLTEFLKLFSEFTENEEVERNFVEGCTQMMRGDYDEALIYFQKVLDVEADNHPTQYNMARIYHSQKKYEEAVEFAQKAVKGQSNNFWYHKFLVKALSSAGSISNAIEAQKDLVKRFPDKIEEQLDLAELYFKSQDFDTGIKVLNQLEKERGIKRPISLRKFEINNSIGRNEAAAKNIQELLDAGFTDIGIYQRQYDALMKLGEVDDAALSLQAVLEQDPQNSFALLRLTDYHVKKGEEEKADQYLFRAFGSSDLRVETKLGIIKKLLPYADENADVRARTEKLIEIFGNFYPQHPELSVLQANLKGETQALAPNLDAYRESLEANPQQTDLWIALLTSSFANKDYKQLNLDAELALEYYPNNSQFLYYYGKSASMLADYSAATYAFNKLKKIALNDPLLSAAANLELAFVYRKNNADEQLMKALEAAKKSLDGANGQMKEIPLYFELLGDYHAIQNDPEAAEKSWMEARKKGAKFSVEEKLNAFGYGNE